jgi:hypothetical protein
MISNFPVSGIRHPKSRGGPGAALQSNGARSLVPPRTGGTLKPTKPAAQADSAEVKSVTSLHRYNGGSIRAWDEFFERTPRLRRAGQGRRQ